MNKLGLFTYKKKIKDHILCKKLYFEDEIKKIKIRRNISCFQSNSLSNELTSDDIVVSVTSYGNRVTNALPYMLYSLLVQSLLPRKIVVYLDNSWSDNNLPKLLVKLKEIGIEFRYVKDIRSYKKLIPALRDFPHNPILTLDDDMYYHVDYIKWVNDAYIKSDKRTVLGQWWFIPIRRDNKYLPYDQWIDGRDADSNSEKSFIGCCGVCYPPYIFDEEILKEDLFMKLCPFADDIWFWAMEERLHIKRNCIEPYGYGFHTSVNRIEEFDLSQKGTLMYKNVFEGRNNTQLRNVIEYYKLEK
jgi:hypothetical protein